LDCEGYCRKIIYAFVRKWLDSERKIIERKIIGRKIIGWKIIGWKIFWMFNISFVYNYFEIFFVNLCQY
jgi:hypothetical protein